MTSAGETTVNRLAKEASPYLRQHQYNPVDWYPWGEEAFAKADADDKPIFLSVGYSTCHWCHVMERESFEDSSVAALLNDGFVSIKVDREERPDLDAIYMTVTQMMTGSGGWPMTVILTPDKKPFFAATYVPKESKWGRLGMLDLLPRLTTAWKEDRSKVLSSADQMTNALASVDEYEPGRSLTATDVAKAAQQLSAATDATYGGLGQAPKFPSPHTLLLMLRHYSETGEERVLHAVEATLQGMRKGGIWDHLGFGFHRYSTDREWLLPHFEKMLYDQALLTLAYTEAHQVTGNAVYAQTAREIMAYVIRELQSPEGGYYSAEDADSEGEEGKFYVWSYDEIQSALGEDAEPFIAAYTVDREGNFRDEASRTATGANILHVTTLGGLDAFADQRKTLFELRESRVHPFKDRKILTDWNGLMIGAAAYAGRALGENAFIQSAVRAADFALTEMRDLQGHFHKRWYEGEVGLRGLLDDYAFMAWGLTELYHATGETNYLNTTLDVTEHVLRHFSDGSGGYCTAPDYGEELLVRQKEIYDGAIPSGNSVMLYNLVRLGHMIGRTEWIDLADNGFCLFSDAVNRGLAGHAFLLLAADLASSAPTEVVLYGDSDDSTIIDMRAALNSAYLPHATILHITPDTDLSTRTPKLDPLLSSVDSPAALVCRGFSCQTPTADPEELLKAVLTKGT